MRSLRNAAAIVFLVGLTASSVWAQEDKNRTVDQYKCRDVMREAGPDRNIAIAFLHGFLLGKSGSQSFCLDTLHRQTEAFIDHCLSNPDGRALDSMMAVKK